jgi:hypothetical protein
MYTKPVPDEDETIPCDICFKEIPVSTPMGYEAGDYIHHYCGLECFAKWQAQVEPPPSRDSA